MPIAIITCATYASAVTSYGPVSVSVSVCHRSVFCRKGWTERAGFLSTCPTYTVFKEIQSPAKVRLLSSGTLSFGHGISIVKTCYQPSSTKVNAQSLISWAIGKLIWQYLRRSTSSLSHCSSTSVYSTIPSRDFISDSWYLFYVDRDSVDSESIIMSAVDISHAHTSIVRLGENRHRDSTQWP